MLLPPEHPTSLLIAEDQLMTIPADEAAFYRQLWISEEETIWLVISDWLQEQGSPYGEVIRDRILTGTTAPLPDDGPAPTLPLMMWLFEYRHRLREAFYEIRAMLPHLQLHTRFLPANFVRILGYCAALEDAQTLNLSYNRLSGEQVAWFIDSPYLEKIVSLEFSWNMIGDVGVSHLAHARLPNLLHLDLSYCRITEQGLLALLDAPWLPQLTQLVLEANLFPREWRAQVRHAAPHAVCRF